MINFVVLRAKDIEATAEVFRALGLKFTEERHGDGPLHLASSNSDLVLEIYPSEEARVDGVLIGIEVDDLDACTVRFGEQSVPIIKPAQRVGGVYRMIIATPEGAEVFVQQRPVNGAHTPEQKA